MDRLQVGLWHNTTLMTGRMPGNRWCRGKHHQIPQEHNAQLEDNSYKLWNQVSKGQHQKRDLPRRLTISTALHSSNDPSDKGLERMEVGYQLKKGGSRINHLMFMDDIKMFGRGTKGIDTLVQKVRIFSGDIKMEFEIEKCALVNIQRGKVTSTVGIQLPDENNIKDIDETGYKYLGIIEGEEIKHQEMKEEIKKEYLKRLKAMLKSKLNSGSTGKAINSWAMPVIRNSVGIVDWKN